MGSVRGLNFRLCDQRLPRIQQSRRTGIDVSAEFLGNCERRQPRASQRDEKLFAIVAVRLSEGREILIVERDLDPARAEFLPFAHDRHVQRRDERDAENDR